MPKFLSSTKNRTDIITALGVLVIISLIIIPLPSWLIDIFIALNIAFSLIILFLTMSTKSVIEFSSFPTLLLLTTIFRLGLNVSTTKLILTKATGTKIIEAFGKTVVGNNYIVGFIIFIIIVLVQFIVITNGSQRVAEVSARFTLDAMPGKQMSIDADLNAGVINDQEAKKRRKNLQIEANFYGSMDGASKFVKGDAVAGIIIVVVNLLGGILIGMLKFNIAWNEALSKYALLTVGSGLVSQLPALLISSATGIIVTRSESDNTLGEDLKNQMLSYPKIFMISGAILFIMGLVPSMPWYVLIPLGIAFMVSGYLLIKEDKEKANIPEEPADAAQEKPQEPENVMHLLNVEPLEVEIGYGLIPLADTAAGGDLLDRIAGVRRQEAIELGIIVQPIRIRDNLQLSTNEYCIKIKGIEVAKGEILCNHYLAIDATGDGIPIEGIKTVEPTFGLPAVWIPDNKKEDAEMLGVSVVDPTTVLITHLSEVINQHAYELLGRQEVKMLIDNIKETYSAVVDELIPNIMSIGEVQKVLQNLLKEKVPVKDLVTILETLADNAITTKDIEVLTEYVRFALGRTICKNLIDNDNNIKVAAIHPKLEQLISNNIQKSFQGSYPALDPETTKKIFGSIKEITEKCEFNNNQPVFLCSPRIRPAFRKLTDIVFPNITVISMNEIPTDVKIETVGMVNV